ncbi:MAG: polysaccharide deacetylase, partial [Pyramidobacter sp.]|nr:polysaccharide deacetylase [Pyramidobacter sp.]
LGYTIAGFDVLGDGGATFSAKKIEAAARHFRPGSIVIYHMNKPQKATFAGLARVIPKLKAKGWRFAKLEDYL